MTTTIENAKIIINSSEDYLILSDEPLPLDKLHSLRQDGAVVKIFGDSDDFSLEYKFPSSANIYIWSPPIPGDPQLTDAVPLKRVA